MSVTHGSKTITPISVQNTATLLLAANPNRIEAWIANNGAATVYVGKDATVTTATGTPIPVGSTLFDTTSYDAWYGIVASTAVDTRVTEIQ